MERKIQNHKVNNFLMSLLKYFLVLDLYEQYHLNEDKQEHYRLIQKLYIFQKSLKVPFTFIQKDFLFLHSQELNKVFHYVQNLHKAKLCLDALDVNEFKFLFK